MNKNIKLAVAGAVLALSATAANAGIIIPAGDWTVDINGNVNAFVTETRHSGNAVTGGLIANANDTGTRSQNSITTGLLPNFLNVSGSTRQNDLDVGFTVGLNPGGANATPLSSGSVSEFRQAFLTFGDKSWGSVKLGKDLGVFASDAILNDMTLLGVGAGAGSRVPNTTTLGRIGSGFLYADWKNQATYTTPNFNGFQATVGITQAWSATGTTTTLSSISTARGGAAPAYEGKASYSFAMNDVTGKIWVSGFQQRVEGMLDNAYAGDIGANINVAGFGLTGYYYGGQGVGITAMMREGFNTSKQARDSDGGYVQATYVLPTKTKVGFSWGQSNLDRKGSGDLANNAIKEQEMWTVGAYHPLTKHLNLVAEYDHAVDRGQNDVQETSNTVSAGAILFF
jgi:predicted porin